VPGERIETDLSYEAGVGYGVAWEKGFLAPASSTAVTAGSPAGAERSCKSELQTVSGEGYNTKFRGRFTITGLGQSSHFDRNFPRDRHVTESVPVNPIQAGGGSSLW
jgi:hypothetical protein